MEYSTKEEILQLAVYGHLVLTVFLYSRRLLCHSRLPLILLEDVIGSP